MAAIVVGVIVGALILWAVFRYRRRSDDMPRQFQYHIPLEITYTVIPVIIVLILFGFTFVTENSIGALPANGSQPAERVTVTAFQWGWKFEYSNHHSYVLGVQRQDPDPVGLNGKTCPQSAADPNDCLGPVLVLPANQATEISLVSRDVIHGFYIPAFNFNRYAQPGIRNAFVFTPTHTGVYRAQCNQLCGLYHSQMYFHVVVLPPAQFRQWIQGNQPVPDGVTAPNTVGVGANNDLPPAYPPGSGYSQIPNPSKIGTSGPPNGTPSTTSSSTTTSSTTTTAVHPVPTTLPGDLTPTTSSSS